MLKLNNLKSTKGTTKNSKRLGRGQGSGQGKQAGKGHKGQKARSGGGVAPGFEGGQMPLYRRLPKKGFSNAPFKKEYAIVNLEAIEAKFDSGEVSRETLLENGMLSGRDKSLPIKVLGKGELKSSLTFKGISKFSASAREQIDKSGSKIED